MVGGDVDVNLVDSERSLEKVLALLGGGGMVLLPLKQALSRALAFLPVAAGVWWRVPRPVDSQRRRGHR
jgi:hypothetical protein